MRRILQVMLEEEEFLGPHGIRAISRRHLEQPVIFDWGGQEYNVQYLPAESDSFLFGGNWGGPVWFPMNVVILRGLIQLHACYGDRLQVECPTGSGRELNLLEVALDVATRLAKTFLEDENGRRPVYGGIVKFQTDPRWHDLISFSDAPAVVRVEQAPDRLRPARLSSQSGMVPCGVCRELDRLVNP